MATTPFLERVRIVLVNTSHPGNIGAAARALKNMGLRRLYLVDPEDHPSMESYSRAVGADDVLGEAVVTATLSEALQGCVWVAGASARDRTIKWPMYTPAECAAQSQEISEQGDVAIVFGREDAGLTNEELELCNALVMIPADPEYSSLNVSQAVQVLCYELRLAMLRDSNVAAKKEPKVANDYPASTDELEGMYHHFEDTMTELGFLVNHNPENIMRRLKGLFNRAQTTKREVNILRGILSSALGRKSARPLKND